MGLYFSLAFNNLYTNSYPIHASIGLLSSHTANIEMYWIHICIRFLLGCLSKATENALTRMKNTASETPWRNKIIHLFIHLWISIHFFFFFKEQQPYTSWNEELICSPTWTRAAMLLCCVCLRVIIRACSFKINLIFEPQLPTVMLLPAGSH